MPLKPITRQEKKILELISQGYSTSIIAHTISISPHTVESHRKSLLLKFGAKNAAELIRLAISERVIQTHLPDSNLNHHSHEDNQ